MMPRLLRRLAHCIAGLSAAVAAGFSCPSVSKEPEDSAEAETEVPALMEDDVDLPRLDEAGLGADFEGEEMKQIAFELGKSFEALHRTDEIDEARLAKQIRICPDAKLEERKSLLPNLKLSAGASARRSKARNPLKAFYADMAPLREQIRQESARRARIRGPALENAMAAFRRSCGFDFRTFLPEIVGEAKRRSMPPEILLSMMTLESGGDCFASVEEGGKDPATGQALRSRGLFQVHAKFTSLRACGDAQKERIRRAQSAGELREGPRCAENPVLNLRAATKVLADKAEALVSGSKTYEIYDFEEKRARSGRNCWRKKRITISAFDKKRLRDKRGRPTRDLWRMAVSAYNGGERWVFRAKRNIDAFNALHGTKVDPYDWNSLKDYYFRRTLSRKQQIRYFGAQERDRDLDYAILNVIYAENLVPSLGATAKGETPNLADLWRKLRRELERADRDAELAKSAGG